MIGRIKKIVVTLEDDTEQVIEGSGYFSQHRVNGSREKSRYSVEAIVFLDEPFFIGKIPEGSAVTP